MVARELAAAGRQATAELDAREHAAVEGRVAVKATRLFKPWRPAAATLTATGEFTVPRGLAAVCKLTQPHRELRQTNSRYQESEQPREYSRLLTSLQLKTSPPQSQLPGGTPLQRDSWLQKSLQFSRFGPV